MDFSGFITEHKKRKCTQAVFIWVGGDLILCAQEIIENQTSWSSAEEQQHFYPIIIDVEKSATNESNFPPTGFKKLPHTIFKMAAQACLGGADSVMHSLVACSVFGSDHLS